MFQDPMPAPSYGSGYYESSSCQPTVSERRIFTSYADHMRYPQTERDMIQRLQTSEGASSGERLVPVFISAVSAWVCCIVLCCTAVFHRVLSVLFLFL